MKTKHEFDMVDGTQEMFRLLLEALSNPGRSLDISMQAGQFTANGQWFAPALTLLDNECCFYWDGDPDVGEEIRFLSGAAQVSKENADFIFLSSASDAGQVLSAAKKGTHRDPHKSAIIFIAANDEPEFKAVLKGPGIPPLGREILVSGNEAMWIKAREEQKFEYPCGVEMLFMRQNISSAEHSFFAITRKTGLTWLM